MGLFKEKFTIVIVCKANITRSAYLQGYMQNYLKIHMPYARKKIRVLSAGVQAHNGKSASQVVKYVAKTNGFNLQGHRSDPLTEKMVKNADVILVMEQYQKDAILDRYQKAEGKTFRMMEYLWTGDASDVHDIPDPTGQNLVDYEEFIAIAHAEVARIFRELDRKGI